MNRYVSNSPTVRTDPSGNQGSLLNPSGPTAMAEAMSGKIGPAIVAGAATASTAVVVVTVTNPDQTLAPLGTIFGNLFGIAVDAVAVVGNTFGIIDNVMQAAGNLKTINPNQEGIDAEALKEIYVEDPGKFNVAVDKESGQVVLVPVQLGTQPNVETDLNLEEAKQLFPN